MEEVLNNILDFMITLEEINLVRQEKLNAVTQKNYELAANLREQEVSLQKGLSNLNDFREWKLLLNKNQD